MAVPVCAKCGSHLFSAVDKRVGRHAVIMIVCSQCGTVVGAWPKPAPAGPSKPQVIETHGGGV